MSCLSLYITAGNAKQRARKRFVSTSSMCGGRVFKCHAQREYIWGTPSGGMRRRHQKRMACTVRWGDGRGIAVVSSQSQCQNVLQFLFFLGWLPDWSTRRAKRRTDLFPSFRPGVVVGCGWERPHKITSMNKLDVSGMRTAVAYAPASMQLGGEKKYERWSGNK